MDIFEYLRTAFHVVKAFATPEKMIYLGLGVLGLFILWTVLSLLLCHEVKMARLWRKMINTISGDVTREKYFIFTSYFQKAPAAAARNWKKYEQLKLGVPSDYILQQDMLDNPISGGVWKQNRSIMKFAMWTVTVFFFMLSLAFLGANEAITAKVLAEAAIVPFSLFLLFRLNYYIYTAVRQYEYKLAVEDFNEFIDFVDAKINVAELFEGQEDYLQVNSNCYESSVQYKIKAQPKTTRKIQEIELKATAQNTGEAQENAEIVPIKEYTFTRNKSGKIEIRSRQDFAEALSIVEKLLDDKSTKGKQNDEKSRRVAELMEAMNKYRNKKMK